MTKVQYHLLFLCSFIGIFLVYSFTLRTIDIVNIVFDQIYFLLALLIVFCISFYYKRKLKGYPILDFFKDSTMSFQNVILFFVVFEVIDYIFEDGFIGMISLWFSYWVFGYIAFMVFNIINYHKNYKLVQAGFYKDFSPHKD
ncbi:MAG TPA: hypothetical protein ENK66_04565 [Arcobacter sp.]|jgi:hypothetical protein|nr:hypothetical protein [Arcobacter sp.]